MILPEQVYLAVEPVDTLICAGVLSDCPAMFSDVIAYAFTNRQRSRLKLLIWDATGVWLCQRWPQLGDSVCMLSAQTWQWLITGIEWQRLEAVQPAHWQA